MLALLPCPVLLDILTMSRSTSSPSFLARAAFRLLCALLLISCGGFNGASATTIEVINHCPYPIWPGVQSNAGSVTPEISGFYLFPGAAFPVHAPYSWSGRIWARTACGVDPTTSNFSCATGSCASGAVACNGFGPTAPVSLAQFNLGSSAEDAMDYYDISLADGFNVPLKVAPMGFGEKSSDCRVTQCDDERCPLDNEDNKSPHICPTAITPSFKLVFCPVPVPTTSTPSNNNTTASGNVTKNMPDVLPPVVYVAPSPPPMPRISNTTVDHPSTNMTTTSAPAPAPASSSSNDTNHKDVPEINININITTISAPASSSAPAPAPVSLGRKGFVPVSSAAVSASTASLLVSGSALLVALLALA